MQFSLPPDKIGFVFIANAIAYATSAPVIGLLADKIVSQSNSHFHIDRILALILYTIPQNPRYIVVCGLLISGLGCLLIGPTSLIPVHPYVICER